MDAVVGKYCKELSNLQVAHYLSAGACALIIWDWLICLSREYQFIWRARPSAGKFLYLIHRYPLIITSLIGLHFSTARDIPVSRCKVWIPIEHCCDILVVAFVQVTLLLRVYALYEKNRCVITALSTLFCVSLITTLIFYSILIQKFFYYTPVSPLVGCFPDCKDCFSWIPTIHMPLFLFDTVLVVLTLKKCVHFLSNERSLLPTLTIVFRDGLIYYIVIFLMMIFNIAFLYITPATMSDWFIPWERSIVAIMGTRLLLNLRGQIEEQRTDDSRFMLHNLNDSEPNHTLQSTTPSAPVARVAWPSRARRGRGMSVHDHDPPADSEGGSVHRDSEDVPLDLEMTRVKGSWKLGSSSKTEADASESEPPPPPPPWRPWKTRCPNDNPSWL